MGGYNKKLKCNNAPFYNLPKIKNNMFSNYFTSASPTLYGTIAMLQSHPNYRVFSDRKSGTFIKLLKQSGYKAILLQGGSKFYGRANIIAKQMGFDQVIAKEDFQKDPLYKKYVKGWGVYDRILFSKLLELLQKHRGEKVYIHVLPVDTHPPHGRAEKDMVSYPNVPFKKNDFGRPYYFLKSVFYHNYDLKLFMERAEEKNLINDEILIAFTADHSTPYNDIVSDIPGYPSENLARIPLALITKQKLPEINHDILSSQLDLAPTIFHLLGKDIPLGWWGDSLFSTRKKNQYVGLNRNELHIYNGNDKKIFNIRGKVLDHEIRKLLNLVNSLAVE